MTLPASRATDSGPTGGLRRTLRPRDLVFIVVGTVIGSGIFLVPGPVLRQTGGDVRLALTAYNRGTGTVDRVLEKGGDPDNGYAGKVLRG